MGLAPERGLEIVGRRPRWSTQWTLGSAPVLLAGSEPVVLPVRRRSFTAATCDQLQDQLRVMNLLPEAVVVLARHDAATAHVAKWQSLRRQRYATGAKGTDDDVAFLHVRLGVSVEPWTVLDAARQCLTQLRLEIVDDDFLVTTTDRFGPEFRIVWGHFLPCWGCKPLWSFSRSHSSKRMTRLQATSGS
jgi:hypothetical protein